MNKAFNNFVEIKGGYMDCTYCIYEETCSPFEKQTCCIGKEECDNLIDMNFYLDHYTTDKEYWTEMSYNKENFSNE